MLNTVPKNKISAVDVLGRKAWFTKGWTVMMRDVIVVAAGVVYFLTLPRFYPRELCSVSYFMRQSHSHCLVSDTTFKHSTKFVAAKGYPYP